MSNKKYDFTVDSGDYPVPEGCEGWISKVRILDKTYALKCEVIALHPISCPKCGGSVNLTHGEGRCDYCGTLFTTKLMMVDKVD